MEITLLKSLIKFDNSVSPATKKNENESESVILIFVLHYSHSVSHSGLRRILDHYTALNCVTI